METVKTKLKRLKKRLMYSVEQTLNGNILVHHSIRKFYDILGLLVVLGLVYISCGYSVDGSMRKKRELTKEIEDLRYKYLDENSTLTQMKRQSSIEDSVKAACPGLEAAKTASYIVISE